MGSCCSTDDCKSDEKKAKNPEEGHGHNHGETEHGHSIFENKGFLIAISGAGISIVLELYHFWNKSFEMPLVVAAIFTLFFGKEVLISGFKNLSKFKIGHISVLMTVAVVAAFFLGEYLEAMVVVALFALGERMEDFGIESSQSELKGLVSRSPKTATTKNGQEVPVESLNIGDVIVVKTGEVIGADGVVLSGEGVADESSMTGESLPIAKPSGAKVLAGTILLSGYVEVEVQKKSVDSTLSKIIQITFESTKEKAELQKFIEKFASIYTPIAIGASLLVFLVPVLFFHGDYHKWLEQALTLLVISCPCSLVISTPVSIYTAVGAAAKRGVIIKGGRVLESLSKITLFAFDKTRTITTGQPEVTDIVTTGDMSENEVLACAAGIEKLSEHPLAQAIVAAAEKRKISPHEAASYKSILGKGAEAECLICSEKKHFIGSRSFALEKITLSSKETIVLDRLEAEGKTCVLIWNKKSVEGILGLHDTIKPESKKAIADLKALIINTAILTGDHEKAGQAVAKEVGVDNVYAGLLPTDKSKIIKELEAKGERVAMVGDGVNDAPALAASTVGIAMGAAGSDAAIEVAGVAILNDNLDSLPFLVRLGRRTWSIIRFNSFFAIGIKIATLGLAFSGFSSLGLAIFADVGVTIIVVIISLLGTSSL